MPEANPFRALGLALLGTGVLLVAGGLLLLFLDKLPGVGRLPGDLVLHRGRWTIYAPITTFVLLSLLATLILNLFLRR